MGALMNNYNQLDYHNSKNDFTDFEYVQAMKEDLVSTLRAFKVMGEIVDIHMTPFAVMFDVNPEPGESIKTYRKLRVDLEVHMASPIEIVSLEEKEGIIGIVIKRWTRPLIGLRDIMESDEFQNCNYVIPIAAGMDVLGKPFVFDITQAPHLLVAGTTGSGKSVFLNTIIMSIILNKTPDEVELIMVDPKMVELGAYNSIPHLIQPVIYDNRETLNSLRWLDSEMMRRYNLFASVGVKTIHDYNNTVSTDERLSRIVMIIDEYMELMYYAPEELEELVKRISRLARSAGVHLVMSTQRPSKNVITPEIKANIPCRASFTVVDWRESKTILDRTGAERLLGSGDMLFSEAASSIPVHAQSAYVSYKEIDRVIENMWNKKSLA